MTRNGQETQVQSLTGTERFTPRVVGRGPLTPPPSAAGKANATGGMWASRPTFATASGDLSGTVRVRVSEEPL